MITQVTKGIIKITMKEYFTEQIRINLSKLALKILNQDLIIFNTTNEFTFNGFINKIIYLYIKNSCEDFKLELNLLNIEIAESKLYRFNAPTMDEYNDSLDILNKKYNIESAAKFFRAILESYTRLPFINREKVMLKDIIDQIHNAINKRKYLRVITYNNTIEIIPFIINRSRESAFSYLIGFDSETKIRAIRLSHIRNLKAYGNSKLPSQEKLNETQELLAEYGPTFIEEPLCDIDIKFLNDGAKQSYEYSIIHRPIHSKILDKNNYIYRFHCSLKQAEYFFFRFAGEIEILEPIELKNCFIDKYKKGFEGLTKKS